MNSFAALLKEIAEIDDPEIRARTRREWGLNGLDENGRPGPMTGDGFGPEASINAASFGRTWEDYFSGDPERVAAQRMAASKAKANAARAALHLRKADVRELHDAVSFAVQLRGALFNTQITIVYGMIGVASDKEATKVLSDYLHELGMRVKQWAANFDYAYVHERSDERGLHTHIISALPIHLRPAITVWSREFFSRRCVGSLPEAACKVQISGVRSPDHRLALHRHRLQYICKGLDPQIVETATNGARTPLIDLLGIPEKRRRPAGKIECAKRCGASHSVSAGRRRGDRALSPFGDRAWPWLYRGWELDEHRDRLHAHRHHADRLHLRRVWADQIPPAPMQDRAALLRAMRSWRGWW